MVGISYPHPPVVKTLSQISEDLYQLETRLLRCDLPGPAVYREVSRIRQDLEPHITSPAHDTQGEGIEQPAALTGGPIQD